MSSTGPGCGASSSRCHPASAAVVLRYYEDLTEAQTAEAMGCAVGTVKSQVAQGLKRLREQMGATAADLLPHDAVFTNYEAVQG